MIRYRGCEGRQSSKDNTQVLGFGCWTDHTELTGGDTGKRAFGGMTLDDDSFIWECAMLGVYMVS